MLFSLATPEYNKVASNTKRIKVHLRNGVAEIYNQHQDLMGKIENNLIEVETDFENKLEKISLVVQDAVFIVSNQSLDGANDVKGTNVYVYAKKAFEITPSTSIEEVTKLYDLKKAEFDRENEKAEGQENTALGKVITSRVLLVSEELEFLRKLVVIVKQIKNS